MRSRVYPFMQPQPSFNSMALDLPLSAFVPPSELDLAAEWECWGEESTIELAYVQLKSDGNSMSVLNRFTTVSRNSILINTLSLFHSYYSQSGIIVIFSILLPPIPQSWP